MGLVIPEPEGPYAVSMSVKVLTDHSRIDPYAPGRQDRQVVVSTFLPVHETTIRCEKTIAPYMTPLVAAEYDQIAASVGLSNETFSALELSLCSPVKPRQCQSSLPLERFPVLIFSPGLGDPRLLYGATAKTIASLGYAVVTIDHPYDASIVEFPDGKVVTAANINPAKASDLEKATRVSVQSFIKITSRRLELCAHMIAGPFCRRFLCSGPASQHKDIAVHGWLSC